MVLPGLAEPHTGSPHPPGGARLGPEVPPAPEGAKIQRKPWAAAALREQGHSPGTPSPSQPGAALPTPGREQGTQGHQRGSPSHARPPMAPGAEPGAASIPPGQGWAAPPATPQEALQGRAPPSPIRHPAALLEAMAAGTPGQQARGGDRETRGRGNPSPHAGHGEGRDPEGRQWGLT